MAFIDDNGKIDYEGLFEAQKYSARMGYRMASIELELHEWDIVAKRDMLLGCSLTGQMDFMNKAKISKKEMESLLEKLKEVAVQSANEMSNQTGLNKSVCVTTGKPSGTISVIAGVSSGCHYSHSPYYIRRVRISAKDPLCSLMTDCGFESKPENGETEKDCKTRVFSFPCKAPEGKTKYDVSAIDQLEYYKSTMLHYIQHNQSVTVSVRNHEWDGVVDWVYENWDDIVGVSFMPLDDTFYPQAPYETIDKETYEKMVAEMPRFKPEKLKEFENFEEEFDVGSDCESGYCPIR